MLYELVTGQQPFVSDDPTAVISQHLNSAPVRPWLRSEHCPPDLEALILRLLAKAPDERPSSAAEVLETSGGRLARRPRHRARPPRAADARALGRPPAARAARPGALRRARPAAARRAHEPPRHRLDPVARGATCASSGAPSSSSPTTATSSTPSATPSPTSTTSSCGSTAATTTPRARQGAGRRPEGRRDCPHRGAHRGTAAVHRPLPREGHEGPPGLRPQEAGREDRDARDPPQLAALARLRVRAEPPLRSHAPARLRPDEELRRAHRAARRLHRAAARRPPGRRRPERGRQVDADQDRQRRPRGRRRSRRARLRDAPRLLRAGRPRRAARRADRLRLARRRQRRGRQRQAPRRARPGGSSAATTCTSASATSAAASPRASCWPR